MQKNTFLLLMVLCASLWPTTRISAELKWDSDTLEYDFPVGTRKHLFVFKFTNASQKDAVIRQVKSSCGCTVPKLTKTSYAAGEQGSILVEFDAGRRQGNFEKSVVVEYDDGTISTKQLKIKVQVPHLANFEPNLLEWRLDGSSEEKFFDVTLNQEIDFDIVDVGSTNENFSVKLKVIGFIRKVSAKWCEKG